MGWIILAIICTGAAIIGIIALIVLIGQEKRQVPKIDDTRIRVEELGPDKWESSIQIYKYKLGGRTPDWYTYGSGAGKIGAYFTGKSEQEVLNKAHERLDALRAAKERKDAAYTYKVTI